MKRIIHWFRAFRVWAGHMPLCPTQAPDWTEGDAGALGAFLRTNSSGRKLRLLIRYQEQAINASAVMRPSGCDYNCGYAAGFRAGMAMLEKLSANVPPHPDDSSQNHDGADDLAERFAP
jgi:hypothetical protein